MPSQKKMGGKGSARSDPHHSDPLRADIAAAADPLTDEGDDIAAQLLASLDARDEAEAQLNQFMQSSSQQHSQSPPHLSKSTGQRSAALDVPVQTDANGSGSRPRDGGIGGGLIGGLREAGGRILNHVSPSGTSPITSPCKGKAAALSPDAAAPTNSPHGIKSSSSGSSGGNNAGPGTAGEAAYHHSLRGIFGSRSEDSGTGERKIGRQKARKQRKDAEAEADRARFEEELKANGGNVDEAEQERQGMGLACDSLGVDIHEINPDGHCLYSAIADQLVLQGLASSSGVSDYQGARRLTAQFMRQHKHDFAPFISDSDERMAGIENKEAGREQTAKIHKLDDRYLDYCHAVETTSVWGGQPEILAMSRALNTPIWVVQAGQPIVKVGQEEIAQAATSKPLLISYHRRMYGLGEHYNSLHPRKKQN